MSRLKNQHAPVPARAIFAALVVTGVSTILVANGTVPLMPTVPAAAAAAAIVFAVLLVVGMRRSREETGDPNADYIATKILPVTLCMAGLCFTVWLSRPDLAPGISVATTSIIALYMAMIAVKVLRAPNRKTHRQE